MIDLTAFVCFRTSRPSTRTLPEVGRLRPSIISNVVVFPAPLGPSTPKVSPCSTEKEMSSTAVRLPYFLVRFATSMLAGMGEFPRACEHTVTIGGIPADNTRHFRSEEQTF